MGSLLFVVLLLGDLSVCLMAQASLGSPVNLKFDSVNYKNVLRWSAPLSNITVQYYVQWKIYGEPIWLKARSCQGIQTLHCDLSSVTAHPREWYYARVLASSPHASRSAWSLSRRFSPLWDTKISPPSLNLNVTEHGLVVGVRPPHGLAQKMHRKLHFRIYLEQADGEEKMYEMDCCTKQLVLNKLNPATRYCLQAQSVIPLQSRRGDRSPPRCATTNVRE